jgi:uncharacterized protein (UPF0548 family)
VREALLGHVDVAAALDRLRGLGINYDEADAPIRGRPGNWHVDHPRTFIAREPAGPPVPGGAWRIACALVRAYEFSDPALVRAVYRPDDELLGRDMLLEGRFLALRFYLGVRVTEVVDETRDDERVWSWGYQTLEGHLEQGKLVYEVIKNLHTGAVELRIRAHSRRAPIPKSDRAVGVHRVRAANPAAVLRRGGSAAARVSAGDSPGRGPADAGADREGLVVAPSGARSHPLERLTLRSHHPGG